MAINKEYIMKCTYCNNVDLICGTLEGVSFVEKHKKKKFMTTGVYGITVKACPECGRLTEFTVDPEALCKLLKK